MSGGAASAPGVWPIRAHISANRAQCIGHGIRILASALVIPRHSPDVSSPPEPSTLVPVDPSRAPAGPAEPSLEATLRRLEARLERLERYTGLPPLDESATPATVPAAGGTLPPAPELESEIGEFWLARVGVVALIVGLAFLVVYPFANLPALLPSAIGYVTAVGLFGLARWWRHSLPETAGTLFNGALFLLFFATLRLHFFSPAPAIESRGIVLVLAGAVLAAQYLLAVRRRSEWTAALATVLVLTTAVLSDTPNLSLALGTVAAAASVWLYRQFDWWRLQLATVVLVYAAHLHWLLGNPLAGHPMRGVTEPHLNLLFLALSGAVFAAAGLLRSQDAERGLLRVSRALFTGGGLLLLGLINARQFHSASPPWIQIGLAVAFLAVAAAYWWHHRGLYGTAIHACFGYLALSAAIMSWFSSPDVFTWLAWQSLLVAATAVWFQSKIITVANLVICGGIFFAYLLLARAAGSVSLSFAVVALLIARILNWQKDRLSLRTEFLRNVYLSAATVIIPYGLYHTVPKSLVSTSWLLAAGGYFLASLILGSKKYRWMAIATIFATIGYVFIVDLSRLEPAYRIGSFLILGVALIGFSIFYARQRKNGVPPDAERTPPAM